VQPGLRRGLGIAVAAVIAFGAGVVATRGGDVPAPTAPRTAQPAALEDGGAAPVVARVPAGAMPPKLARTPTPTPGPGAPAPGTGASGGGTASPPVAPAPSTSQPSAPVTPQPTTPTPPQPSAPAPSQPSPPSTPEPDVGIPEP
jgi:hypothetical protein